MAGFDWLLLDAEHAPNDVLSLIPQLMALKDSASAPVVRPPWNDTVLIKRLLDAGCCNFLIPFVETAAQARAAVAATRYPPQGVRGVSVSQRGNRYGSVPGYFEQVNEQIALVVQIESRAGVAAAAEIAAVDGVDGLFIGPSDLAAAYGHLGNPAHAEVQQAIAQVHERRARGRQGHRHPGAGGGRRAALPGHGHELRRRRQRPGRAAHADAGAVRQVPRPESRADRGPILKLKRGHRMSSTPLNIGFIGLGIMGAPMALHLIKAGHQLFVYTHGKLHAEVAASSATQCASAKGVAERADIVFTMVPDTPDVEAVLFGAEGVAAGLIARARPWST